MTIVIIGLGSMGKRRVRLIRQLNPDIEIIGVDNSLDKREEASEVFNIKVYSSLEKAIRNESLDVAFVATSPLTHSSIITMCLQNNMHVFTELNLVSDGYSDIIKLANDKNLKLFISSTLLYRKDLAYIANRVTGNKVNYMYHVGQYLPDWHPWEDYKNYFVGNKKTNGCREIFAIDLPWIIRTFGEIEDINVMKDKNSQLDIDYNDNYIVSFKHKNGNKGTICVDVISRKAVRALEVFSEKVHIFWRGTPNSLYEYDFNINEEVAIKTYEYVDKDERYSENIIENAYLDEIITFFKFINDKEQPIYTIYDDLKTLDLIDRIEEE
ncbi:Gfo/Idh/MocA family oxidoreductase [Clostridium sp. CTA-7]